MNTNTLKEHCRLRKMYSGSRDFLDGIFLKEDRKTLRVPDDEVLHPYRASALRRLFLLRLYQGLAYLPFAVILFFSWAHLLMAPFESLFDAMLLAAAYGGVLAGVCFFFTRGKAERIVAQMGEQYFIASCLLPLRDEEMLSDVRSVANSDKAAQKAVARGITLYEAAHLLGCPKEVAWIR